MFIEDCYKIPDRLKLKDEEQVIDLTYVQGDSEGFDAQERGSNKSNWWGPTTATQNQIR